MTGTTTAKRSTVLFRVPLSAQSVIRIILLVGFLVLLMLIAGIGYWSIISFTEVEQEISNLHATEANHLRVTLKISETAGKMAVVARPLLANDESSIMSHVGRRNLNDLKREMDRFIQEGRLTALVETKEWSDFEAAFGRYWNAINESNSVDWSEKREELNRSLVELERLNTAERESIDHRSRQLRDNARSKILSVILSALGVGVVVTGLTFYEIRRILAQVGEAYTRSAETRDYLQSLLDSLVSGVLVLGKDGVVQTVSKSFRRLTGLGDTTTEGESFEHLFRQYPGLNDSIRRELESQTSRTRYFGHIETKKGRRFDLFASPLILGDEIRGLILALLDVTEAHKAQTELRRNRALTAVGQMTAQIAHEIKNPLGSIRFATELLKRGSVIKAQTDEQEVIDIIERSVDHLATIVSELSEFARPKELKRTEVSMSKLLDDLLPMVADRVSSKGVEIERAYSPDLPPGHYDPTELRKLFLNLIINAIDASEPGGRIKVQTRGDGNGGMVVDVIDSGCGMDEETLGRLFEPFYTTKKSGTGLGMAIAKKIAELHKGDLLVASEKGKGTTVSIRLPID